MGSGVWAAFLLEDTTKLVGVGVVAVLFLVFWIFGAKAKKKRREALKALATQLGFSYKEINERFVFDFTFGYSLFPDKENRRAEDQMEGSISGLHAAIFDFVYETESVDNSSGTPITTTHRKSHTVAAFESAKHQLPEFELKKKGLFSGLSKHAKFESNPEFAERFTVTGSDLEAIQRAFNPQVIQALSSVDRSLHLSGERHWLVFWSPSGQLKPEQWRGFLEASAQIASEFFRAAATS